MRGADGCSESVFTTLRLEDLAPANHPLRPIRTWVSDARATMDAKFSSICEADVTDGRPSIAPEKFMHAMLLQVLYSVRSERRLVEQVGYSLLLRWFVGSAIEDKVWTYSVFSKNRARLIEHDGVGVPSPLIQAWTSHKSMGGKNGSYDGRPPEDWRGELRSNDTHGSTTDPDSRLYRKSHAAPALPSYLVHVLTDDHHCLVVNVQASTSDGTAESNVAAQMLADIAGPGKRATLGADKADETKGFVRACREINVTPHVAQNLNRNGGSAIDAGTTRHAGYEISQRKSKCIEQCFGWGKVIGPIRQVMVQGLDKVDRLLTLTMAARNLTRLRILAQWHPQCAQ